jgi:hypothetical protein
MKAGILKALVMAYNKLARDHFKKENKMTTWKQYETVKILANLCATYGFIVRRGYHDNYAIGVDNARYPAFVADNTMYSCATVEEAIAWIQGMLSDTWRKAMKEGL